MDMIEIRRRAIEMAVASGGGATFGTFTTDANERSITIPDAIGKHNIIVFPMFDIATAEITARVHWGGVLVGDRPIMVASANSGKNSYVFNSTFNAATGNVSNGESLNPATGTVSITAGADSNYGGYFVSGKQYGYVTW